MKKKIIFIIITILIIGIGYFTLPSLMYSTAFGQKIWMKLEGDQVADFYFKENQTTKDTVYMKGVIYSNTYEDIKEVLEKHPEITTLVMENVPGSIDDETNLIASKEIRKHQINTYIPENGEVASGGTDMFLAGKKRAAHPTAKFGVHSWAGEDSVALDFPKDHIEHKKYLDYYEEMNIPLDFYWYTLEAAPAHDIHWMTVEEIKKYEVISSSTAKNELLEIQKTLASDEYEGRGTGNNQKTQQLIRNYFSNLELKKFNDSYDDVFTFKERKTKKEREATNIIGYITGKKYPDKYIVIGAHYDHLGVINDTIYNGADDNASGTSALLVLAKHFTKNVPEHSIIFAAFDAEELGLHGSFHFVNNPPIPLDDIKMNFNFDMISRNPKNEIYVVGTFPYPQFKPLIESVAKNSSLNVMYGHDDPDDKTKDYWMYSSDNGPFFTKEIANITFSEEDHPGYHQATDDFEYTNSTFYIEVVDLIKKSIENIDHNFPKEK
ncbi:M28 family peptidase [Aquimarina sp. 2201CG5-10]|uniref:M28 family peptidase n=1 Tax=Aquimarina callyspongiae TaxID=3098150 RepID=UPI002AB37144|nr:M28 family peptidase [Aquimarina sp. 2201CG5-10]MDY8135902.1 M28 family peptidase [Aquimarina sp. 2201CG5-10]